MLTVIANKTEAIVADDRRKIYTNVTREEAKRMTLGRTCIWKDREVLYSARDYYIGIGFKLDTENMFFKLYVIKGGKEDDV